MRKYLSEYFRAARAAGTAESSGEDFRQKILDCGDSKNPPGSERFIRTSKSRRIYLNSSGSSQACSSLREQQSFAIRRTLMRSSLVSMTLSCRHPQERLHVSLRISTDPGKRVKSDDRPTSPVFPASSLP